MTGFMSDSHLDPGIAVEVSILERAVQDGIETAEAG
jgi:hypothetical protein